MNQKETIISLLKEMDDSVLIAENNQMNCETGAGHYINNNEDNDLEICFSSITDALRACCYGNYNYIDEYFIIDDYGNLESFSKNDLRNYIDFDELADYVIANDFYEIQEVWYDDVLDEFYIYFCENLHIDNNDENYEKFIAYVDGRNLVTEDWDELIDYYENDIDEDNE